MKGLLEERFWSKVDIAGPDECWPWTGHLRGGYGRIKVSGRHVSAHRAAFELATGKSLAEQQQIDHRCFNRACCNPRHLRAVSHKQNRENLQGAYRSSQTGVRGVSRHCGRYEARVSHHGKRIYVGFFATLEEADAAVRTKRLELYTHNDLDRRLAQVQLAAAQQLALFDIDGIAS
jgi:hypothetical protein